MWQKLCDKKIGENVQMFKRKVNQPVGCMLGGPTVIQNLTDSPHNQNVVLLVLQNSKSKISEKSDQN